MTNSDPHKIVYFDSLFLCIYPMADPDHQLFINIIKLHFSNMILPIAYFYFRNGSFKFI